MWATAHLQFRIRTKPVCGRCKKWHTYNFAIRCEQLQMYTFERKRWGITHLQFRIWAILHYHQRLSGHAVQITKLRLHYHQKLPSSSRWALQNTVETNSVKACKFHTCPFCSIAHRASVHEASGVLHEVFSRIAPAQFWVQPLWLKNCVGKIVGLDRDIE